MGLNSVGPGMTRRALAVAVIVAMTTGTAACGGDEGSDAGGAPKNVTLRFNYWGNQDRAEVTNKMIALFQQKNPTIKVESSFAEFNAYFQKLATETGGGGGADIIQMDYRYIREYGERNVLTAFNEGGVDVDTKEINPALLSAGQIRGKLFALPLGQNTQVFWYDKAKYTEAGATLPTEKWTWADFAAAAKKVSDANKGTLSGSVDPGGTEDWFEVYLAQQGKQLYDAEGKVAYTAADVAAWWQLTDGWRKSGAVTPAELTSKIDGSQANDPVSQKKAAAGFLYDSGLTAKSWEIYGRELTLNPFPSDSDKLGQYAKPAMQIAITRKSEHPKEAAKFVDFFINDPEAAKILGMSRGLPVNAKNRDLVGATLAGPPAQGLAYEKAVVSRLTAAPPPPPKGAGAVKTSFQRIYDDVIFGRSTPQQAADKFLAEAKQALSA